VATIGYAKSRPPGACDGSVLFRRGVRSAEESFPFKYDQHDFDNGLRLITVPTDYPNVVALYIVVQAGSRNEVEPGKSGFAHFLRTHDVPRNEALSAGEVRSDNEAGRCGHQRLHER
jgi:hypothetical protein